MAEKKLNTRIILKHDELAQWEASSLILKKGEIALVEVGKNDKGNYEAPTYLMKVGDGVSIFKNLKWVVANAADVYAWAKQETLPIETDGQTKAAGNGISSLTFTSTTLHPAGALVIKYTSFDTAGAAEAAQKAAEAKATELNNAMDTRVTALETAIGENGSVAKQISDKIDTLNAEAVTAGTGEVISEVSESKGVVTIKKKTLTEADIPALSINKITNLETTLSGKETKGAAATALQDAKADAAKNYATIKHDHTVADITDLDTHIKDFGYATTAQAQGYANAKDSAISKAQSAADKAQKEVDALETLVGVIPEGATSTNVVDYVGEKISAIPKQTDYSVTVDTTTPEGVAKSYAFKQLGKTIATINIPKDMVVESGKVVTDPAGQAKGTYIELTLANAEKSKLYINVGNLIEYVTSGSKGSDQIVVAINEAHKVTATLSNDSVTLAQLKTEVQNKIEMAHSHDNKSVLDGISSTKVTNWDNAEKNANSHADQKVKELAEGAVATNADAISAETQRAAKAEGDLTGRINDLTADSHTHDNGETLNGITPAKVAAWDGAVKIQHSHTNIDELNKIAVGDKAKWDASEQNAKAYADGLAKNYATAAQGKRADSALQSISTTLNGGLKVTNTNKIDIDDAVTFIFDCGTATTNIS